MTSENDIKRLILAGNNIKEVAKLVGVSVQYVYRVVNKNNIKGDVVRKNGLILNMIYDGISDQEIAKQLSVSRATIYRVKRKEAATAKELGTESKLTSWSVKTFDTVQDISKKYRKILSMKGIYIDIQEIESVLLDLMIHTDQKDIKNKDAYFRKYCPLKISNLSSRFLKNRTESLSDEGVMDHACFDNLDPERMLIIKEDYIEFMQ